MEIHHGRGYVYSIQYHVVWCVKYRRKILNAQIEKSLLDILYKVSQDNGFSIIEANTNEDHVHLLIDCTPQHYIPDILKALKGVSARMLMKEYGNDLRKQLWGGHVWNRSYFVATVSENTEQQVKEYITRQKEK